MIGQARKVRGYCQFVGRARRGGARDHTRARAVEAAGVRRACGRGRSCAVQA